MSPWAPSVRIPRSAPGPSAHRGPAARCSAGFTLVELMISLVLLAFVLTGVFSVLLSVQREYVRQRDANRSEAALRTAEMAISAVLRSAEADPFDTGDGLLDPNPLNHAEFDNLRVKADHNPADGDFDDPLEDVLLWVDADTLYVRWQSGGTPQPYVHPLRELVFQYYDSDGTELTTTTQIDEDARRVRMTLAADKGPRSAALDRREAWVYLRNRD